MTTPWPSRSLWKRFRPRVEKAWKSLLRRWLIGLIIALFIFGFLLLLWLPEWWLRNAKLDPKERIPLENSIRTTWAQILGGTALIISLYFAWRRIAIAETTLDLSVRGQVTERFTKAIDQLGSERLQIRLGGIYALEAIAYDSPSLHYPIMEVLTAYVRENSRWKEGEETQGPPGQRPPLRPATDIQAILTVLGRRRVLSGDRYHLFLGGVDIRGTYAEFADFNGANFGGAHLDGASFDESKFKEAGFGGAHLTGSHFTNCDLQKSIFVRADLAKVKFYQARLGGADLKESNLEGAWFVDADLCGADLRRARGATVQQIAEAWTDSATQLPDYLSLADIEAARRDMRPYYEEDTGTGPDG